LHFVYPWADEIIACSDGVRQDLIAYAGLRIGHLRTIFNPIVRPELFIESNKAVEHKWITESDGIPLILAIGRMTQQKDFTTLIKAVSLINQTRRARLIILGDGEDRVELERLILSLDIQDVVDLPGFLDNPYPFYKHADAFVLSSRWEGLPSVLIEALALDCPIVSTNCPYGADEILNGGEFGEIIPMGDVTLMADAISASLNGKKSGKPSQDWISQFSMDVIFLELVDALGLR
jgi:glycosyltransferase involved in cell wall biosynthesis